MTFPKVKRKIVTLICTALIAAMALTATGCAGNNTTGDAGDTSSIQSQAVSEASEQTAVSATDVGITVLGEGEMAFGLDVVDAENNESKFEIHTDKKTVGEALLDLGVIEGENGEYGLYVKTVNGITADYDTDGTYWAFYIDGEYAMTGVDQTDVVAGSTYMFKVEKGQ